MGDLDGRGARAQRGERVDAPLDAVAGLHELLEVGVADAVGLVVDDQRGAVGLVGETSTKPVSSGPSPRAKAKACSRCTARAAPSRSRSGAAGEGGDQRLQVGHVGVGELGLVGGGDARGPPRRPARPRRRAGRGPRAARARACRARAGRAPGVAGASASRRCSRRLLLGQPEAALEVEAVRALRVARERRVAQRRGRAGAGARRARAGGRGTAGAARGRPAVEGERELLAGRHRDRRLAGAARRWPGC